MFLRQSLLAFVAVAGFAGVAVSQDPSDIDTATKGEPMIIPDGFLQYSVLII